MAVAKADPKKQSGVINVAPREWHNSVNDRREVVELLDTNKTRFFKVKTRYSRVALTPSRKIFSSCQSTPKYNIKIFFFNKTM